MNKKLISILAVGMIVSLSVVLAGEVADWSTGGGSAILSESGGTMTFTVDTITPTTISGSPAATLGAISGTSVTASGKVSSYGYPAVVGHTNGSSQVFLTQSGSVVGGGETTKTQTLSVVYIATPNVVITSSDAAAATNAPYIGTIASNQFTVVTGGYGTNFQWIAHGRIK